MSAGGVVGRVAGACVVLVSREWRECFYCVGSCVVVAVAFEAQGRFLSGCSTFLMISVSLCVFLPSAFVARSFVVFFLLSL